MLESELAMILEYLLIVATQCCVPVLHNNNGLKNLKSIPE
jgi:hypothetical protein